MSVKMFSMEDLTPSISEKRIPFSTLLSFELAVTKLGGYGGCSLVKMPFPAKYYDA
jgi:hypothetical protein